MNRRELLGAVGLGATGLAGFAGARAGGAGRAGSQETTTGTTATDDADGVAGVDSAAERPFATITVGTREGVRNPDNNLPHAVRVWNDAERARTVGLTLVRDGADGPALLDRRVEFPADGYLTLRLLEPGSYALAVRPGAAATTAATTAAADSGASVEIPRSLFDCNDSATEVAVTPDGRVRAETVTTEIGCPPEVVERTFTAFGGSCGSADDARVSFTDDAVTVRGSVRAPNPCYGARLAEVAVPSADTLRVTVAATEPSGGVCAQCVATVEYGADFAFRDRVPATVEVVHRRDGETTTVATASRGATTATDAGTTTGR